ncbi:MAG: Rrf2 family transcriptional regulator [Candidatus Omnitrophica bacterium]|nr:Rrf2 family transcriptional regulator [Candidatus Omnitrophota bacterium]
MKISTRARYGSRLMIDLGIHYGEKPVFLKEIAKSQDISEKYLSQIILLLKSAGLVNSFRGAHGGYVLAKPPDKISMKDIVGVLEGGFNLVECVKDSSKCPRVSQCVTRDLWHILEESISDTLSGFTLDDMINKFKAKQAQLGEMYHI